MNETNYELESIQQQLSGVWPNWRVTKKLGNGSYGSVYEIIRNDLAIKYTCALKVLNMRAQDSGHYESADYTVSIDRITDTDIDEFVHGVTSEIEAMIRLKGVPNIVTIEDYALLRNPYGCTILIRMEELEPMESYFKRKGGTPAKEDLVRLGTDICSALSFCEQNHILHRDIKPGNLFYSEKAGFKLGDFGISRTVASIREKASMSGIGTPRYIAPEIYHGERYNNTADIYSFGLVLYVLANGFMPPLCGDEPGLTPDTLSTSRLHEANMRRLNEGKRLPPPRYADESLASVICTACEPKPENRFQTAEAFRNALLSCLQSKPEVPKKKPVLLYGMIAAAALILILLIGGIMGNKSHTPSAANSASDQNSQMEPEASANEEADTDADTGSSNPISSGSGTNEIDDSSEAVTEEDVLPADGTSDEDSSNVQVGTMEGGSPGSEVTDSNAVIVWTDPNLQKAVVPQVKKKLGIDSDNITVADARKISDLDLTDAGVTDISSLQYFVGLSKLNLCNNAVSDLSALTGLQKLEDLNLEKNLVSDLSPLAGLDRLTRLDLYANDIMDITPIAGLTQLRNLDIRANKIQDISPLKDMVLMEKLYMSDNMDLYDLSPLSNMPSLHYLSVKNTSVSQINPLKNDTNLDSLIIRQTNVSDISVVDSLSSLAYLDIRNCPIHDYGPANRFADRKGTKLEK